MVVKIQKWGNSQGLRLAKHVLQSAKLEVGDDVEVLVSEEEIRLKKKTRPKFVLGELAARMRKNFRCKEETFGKPVGGEEW